MENKIQMLTIKETARHFKGLTEYRIRQMCIKGEIPCFKAGNKYLINERKVVEYFNNL